MESLTRVVTVLSSEGLGFVADRLLRRAASGGAPDSGTPARVRRAVERLGPLYVKFGQILSTRQDLLPAEYCLEFSKLQSHVAPFDPAVARRIVIESLGRPIEEVFSSFDTEPLAAASLAQVHGATLLDGSDVVVKVQRPDAAETVTKDVDMLLTVSAQLDRFLPPYKANHVHDMARRFGQTSMNEINFMHEVDVAERFAKNFANDDDIVIPKMHRELCSARVVVMERIRGTKLGDLADGAAARAAGFEPSEIVRKLFRTILFQAYVHGLIHGDLHPGNVFVLKGGRLALIDFGLYEEMSRSMQNAMFRQVLFRSNHKHEELAEALVEVMTPTAHANPPAFKREIIELSRKAEHATLAEYSVARSLQDEAAIAARHGFIAPDEIMVLGRSLVIAEGAALRFDPTVKILDLLQPITRDVAMRRFDVQRIAKDALMVVPDILEAIELAPAFYRNLLKIERAFAKSADLSDRLLGRAQAPEPRPARSLGPWLFAGATWLGATVALVSQAAPIHALGDLSLPSGILLFAAIIATVRLVDR